MLGLVAADDRSQRVQENIDMSPLGRAVGPGEVYNNVAPDVMTHKAGNSSTEPATKRGPPSGRRKNTFQLTFGQHSIESTTVKNALGSAKNRLVNSFEDNLP